MFKSPSFLSPTLWKEELGNKEGGSIGNFWLISNDKGKDEDTE